MVRLSSLLYVPRDKRHVTWPHPKHFLTRVSRRASSPKTARRRGLPCAEDKTRTARHYATAGSCLPCHGRLVPPSHPPSAPQPAHGPWPRPAQLCPDDERPGKARQDAVHALRGRHGDGRGQPRRPELGRWVAPGLGCCLVARHRAGNTRGVINKPLVAKVPAASRRRAMACSHRRHAAILGQLPLERAQPRTLAWHKGQVCRAVISSTEARCLQQPQIQYSSSTRGRPVTTLGRKEPLQLAHPVALQERRRRQGVRR